MPGPPPIPIPLRLLRGNPSKRPIPAGFEPEPPAEPPLRQHFWSDAHSTNGGASHRRSTPRAS
jgi:hypothetical protein